MAFMPRPGVPAKKPPKRKNMPYDGQRPKKTPLPAARPGSRPSRPARKPAPSRPRPGARRPGRPSTMSF